MKINEQVAIITGSTRGIGYSLAKSLVNKGAAVVINGREFGIVQETLDKLRSIGGKVAGVAGSVENPETGRQLVNVAIEEFGKVSILVNNAGIIYDNLSYKMTEEEFSKVIDVHVKGAFYCIKPFITAVKEQGIGGHIINMTSDSGLLGNIGQLNYSAAKAALNGMTMTLAKELKRNSILVNSIAPAALTDMTRPYVEIAQRKAAERGECLPESWQIGSAEAVADFVTKLIEMEDHGRTGEIYGVNGERIILWKPFKSVPIELTENR